MTDDKTDPSAEALTPEEFEAKRLEALAEAAAFSAGDPAPSVPTRSHLRPRLETLEELLEKGKQFAQAATVNRACADCGAPIPAGVICDPCMVTRSRVRKLKDALESVPDRFEDASFRSPKFPARVRNQQAIGQARSLRHMGSLVFVGPSGTGKTTLAVATLRDRLEHSPDERCLFASSIHVSRDQGLVVRAMGCRLLLLDDLGSERSLPSNPVPDIIFDRHQANRCTWVTTWMTALQMADRYGGGVARRIFEHAAVIDCG
jgi:hypothetical protein